MIFATINLDFARKRRAHKRDLKRVGRTATVILAQELRYRFARWGRSQPNDPNGSPGGEAVYWRKNKARIRRAGWRIAAKPRGLAMTQRAFPYVDVVVEGIGTVRAISVHMPPARYRKQLWSIYQENLHALIKASPHPVIVGGDWNWLLSNDPAELTKTFDMKWKGRGIDGFALSPELVPHIRKTWHWQPVGHVLHRHPVIYLELGPKEKKK